ncbi:MAG: energy transducer TonB [Bacteroidia bacterium]|nr:energy transducer TonB [Bacteroidia bacterium]
MKNNLVLIILAILSSSQIQAQSSLDSTNTRPSFFDENAGIDSSYAPNKQDEDIMIFVEQMPEFNGDISKFIASKIKYPKDAREKKIEAKVIAQFIIEKDGSISNIEIVKKAGWGFDEETIRVIKLMPPWKPGKQNGKPVRVEFNLPIKFTLN